VRLVQKKCARLRVRLAGVADLPRVLGRGRPCRRRASGLGVYRREGLAAAGGLDRLGVNGGEHVSIGVERLDRDLSPWSRVAADEWVVPNTCCCDRRAGRIDDRDRRDAICGESSEATTDLAHTYRSSGGGMAHRTRRRRRLAARPRIPRAA